MSFGALMHAIVYLSRFHAQYGDPKKAPNYFPLNTFTLHRLVLTSCLVAAKFYDDSYFKNAFFARVGGGKIRMSPPFSLTIYSPTSG